MSSITFSRHSDPQLAVLQATKRNNWARGLDYVGYIPALGTVAGVARCIGCAVAAVFWTIKKSQTESETPEIRKYQQMACAEAIRGLLEITWVLNIFFDVMQALQTKPRALGTRRFEEENRNVE